jgi:outer membrane protein TolC
MAARSARLEAARSSALAADALPDPKLFAGIDNLPINGPDRWSLERDFMTMQKIGLMQDVPNSAKLRARAEVADAAIARAEAEREVEAQKLRREAAMAWINRYYVEQRIALLDDLERENRTLAAAVLAQLAGGRGLPSDTVMPRQEAAQIADRRDDLARDLAKSKIELRRLVGPEGDEPLAGDPPDMAVHGTTAVASHPELAAFSSMLREAQAQMHEAQAQKRPDWGVQLAYQRRGPQYSDMVSVQFTFDLPLFASTRRDPQIAARQQDLARVEAERESMLREHVAELESDLAEFAALERQLERTQQSGLPLAQEKVDLLMASYRGGKSDLATLLAARRELIEQRLKRIELLGRRDAIAAKVQFAYGSGKS